MLDPVSQIAFEMHTCKGVFALLLGSGISYAAKIPTGWAITLDLVRKVAALEAVDCGADAHAWYVERFKHTPGYSALLDQLATTPTLRQQLIRPYIEPSEQERERGEKQPTAAHRAIAELMAKGYVRVVLTTNFDRLLEQALSDLGVQPTVISSASQVAGALPLVHAGPTIVKLHGDYLDTRSLNTEDELASYAPELERLLERVVDEFGLIVCGWSGEWDIALREAIERSPSRRFPTYWAAKGEPGEPAKAFIERRGARLVPIDGADPFFDGLHQQVVAVERLRKPHPLSAEIAVSMLKEYLPEPRHQIRLVDLITGQLQKVMEQLDGPPFHDNDISPNAFGDQVERYHAVLGSMLPMAYTAGMWSTVEQAASWAGVVRTLGIRLKERAGLLSLICLRAYPATLLMYAFCLGAVVNRNWTQFATVAAQTVNFGPHDGGKIAAATRLNIGVLIKNRGQDQFKTIPAYANKSMAGSAQVADVLRPLAQRELASAEAFDDAFARVEMAFMFLYAAQLGRERDLWAPAGQFVYNNELTHEIIDAWEADFRTNAHVSVLNRMTALDKEPRFGDVKALCDRLSWL